jgi:hypothetical protein
MQVAGFSIWKTRKYRVAKLREFQIVFTADNTSTKRESPRLTTLRASSQLAKTFVTCFVNVHGKLVQEILPP